MQSLILTRKELLTLLELVDIFNPPNEAKLGSGRIKVISDNSSGIGSIVTAEVDHYTNGYYGKFVKVISDESDW